MNAIIDSLELMQAAKNEGRGVCCVRSIIIWLRKGDIESARACWFNESDKLRSYPDIFEYLQRMWRLQISNTAVFMALPLEESKTLDEFESRFIEQLTHASVTKRGYLLYWSKFLSKQVYTDKLDLQRAY